MAASITHIMRWNVPEELWSPKNTRINGYNLWCDAKAVLSQSLLLSRLSNIRYWHQERRRLGKRRENQRIFSFLGFDTSLVLFIHRDFNSRQRSAECRFSLVRRELAPFIRPSLRSFFWQGYCRDVPSWTFSFLLQHGEERDGLVWLCRQGALSDVCRIYPAEMIVLHGLKFSEHSDEVVFIRKVFVKELSFISPVVCLLVGAVFLDCDELRIFRFSFSARFIENIRGIMETRMVLCNFGRDAYFWNNGIEICLWSPYMCNVSTKRISCLYDDAWIHWVRNLQVLEKRNLAVGEVSD